jgi:nucleoside diphosphate kinase
MHVPTLRSEFPVRHPWRNTSSFFGLFIDIITQLPVITMVLRGVNCVIAPRGLKFAYTPV